MTTPTIQLFPEWHPQTCVWVGWPSLRAEWGDAFEPARAEIAEFVNVLSQFAPVRVVAGNDIAAGAARKAIGGAGEVIVLPMGDIWLRDTGPIFALEDGEPVALGFKFDGWGGKFVIPGDTETAAAMADAAGIRFKPHNFVLEGGAIEVDGTGHLISTHDCLIDGVRNPAWRDGRDAHPSLEAALGVSMFRWLHRGLLNDHTDGHVDNLARFIGPNRLVCQTPSGRIDPNARILKEVADILSFGRYEIETLPSPGRVATDGMAAPASHMNFLITNGAVILPSFDAEYAKQAARKLGELMPDHEIIPLPASAILAGGGTFHCMTREQPDFTVTP